MPVSEGCATTTRRQRQLTRRTERILWVVGVMGRMRRRKKPMAGQTGLFPISHRQNLGKNNGTVALTHVVLSLLGTDPQTHGG